jgi:hypothetical protein
MLLWCVVFNFFAQRLSFGIDVGVAIQIHALSIEE